MNKPFIPDQKKPVPEDEEVFQVVTKKPKKQKMFRDKNGLGLPIYVQNRYHIKKRTIAEREHDLALESELYLAGNTHMQIAEALSAQRHYSLSLDQVSRDIEKIVLRWQETYLDNINQAKLRELALIDKVEKALWASFEKSLRDITEIHRVRVVGKNDKTQTPEETGENSEPEDPASRKNVDALAQELKGISGKKRGMLKGIWNQGRGFVRERTSTKTMTTYGDTTILERILKCVELRSKILGIITNKTSVSVSWRKDAEREGYDPDELFAQTVEFFQTRRAALDGEFSVGSDEGSQPPPQELPDGRQTLNIPD